MSDSRLSLTGSRALLYERPGIAFDLEAQARFWALAAEAGRWPGVREAIPGMTNLTLLLAAPPLALAPWQGELDALWASGITRAPDGRLLEIDTTYGGAGGPHLAEVAQMTGLGIDAVVEIHAAVTYTVYAVGSHAGYCYLGGLDPRLATPRRDVPLTRLPAGSLSVAGLQTGMSASAGPSGWNTIGHGDVAFFDPTRDPAALLAPGDRIRFNPVEVIA